MLGYLFTSWKVSLVLAESQAASRVRLKCITVLKKSAVHNFFSLESLEYLGG